MFDHFALRAQRHQHHPQLLCQQFPALDTRFALLTVAAAQGRVEGVELQLRAVLGKAQQAGGGQGVVERVGQRQQEQVAVARQQAQLLFHRRAQGTLVADDDRQAARAQHFAGATQGDAKAVGLGYGFGMQRLVDPGQAAEQLQQALLAAPRFDFVVLVVAEHQAADAVVVAQGGPADQRRGLGGEHRFEHQSRAEEQALALFDENVDRPLALLMEEFGMRLLGACGHAPVDVAHIVAGLVDPYLVEVDSAATQLRVVQPHQRAALAGPGEQLHFAHTMTHLDQLGEADTDSGRGQQAIGHGFRRRRRRRGCAGSPGPGQSRRPRPRRKE
ncbi:hypothetical protein D9M71_389270 [compost metagenome]